MYKMSKLKQKLLVDLVLVSILIPSIVLGFLSAPFMNHPWLDIDPSISGICASPTFFILPYLIITWLFYDKYPANPFKNIILKKK